MAKFTKLKNTQISAMTGAELLVLFNEAAVLIGAPICKRFSSHASGFTRTMKIVEQAREHEAAQGSVAADPAMNSTTVTPAAVKAKVKAEPKAATKPNSGPKFWPVKEDGSCPKCGADHSSITPAGLEGTAAEQRNFCHACSLEWWPENGKEFVPNRETPGVRSAAVAESWKDKAIRDKRTQRTGVRVTGGKLKAPADFPSVSKAFLALHLPMSKHIKFRGAMKAAGAAKIDDYTFTAVPFVREEKPVKKPKNFKVSK